MSVHAAERGEDKLDVQKKAEKLIAHTVHIMTNEKVFNPKYSDFHQRIVDCAVEIGACIWEANGIRANNSEHYADRHRLQEKAVRKIGVLLYLMSIAKRLDKNLRRGKYNYWVHLARETKDIAIAWRDSDAKKFRRLIQDAGCNAQRVDALGEPGQRQQRGNRELDGQLQQQQRDQRESRGAGSCRETRREGCTKCNASVKNMAQGACFQRA